jgi:hypothetical protein
VTTATYKAANVSQLSAADIRSGVSVAGVAGSLGACASDGAAGCVTVAGFKAADMTAAVSGHIKAGITIAGVNGTYPSSTHTLPGAGGTSDLVSLAASTSAGSYEWWGPDGTRYTGTITDAGAITPTAASQAFSTSVYRQFTVAGDADLVAGNVKSGVSLFGVSGDYPSASHPLAGADSTADLDAGTFDAKVKSATAFEWFDSAGVRYTGAGDVDLTAANVASGVTIFGEAGTLAVPSNCSTDGQISCVTTARYKSMDTDPTMITTWDIRYGKTAGGIAGSLAYLRNMADMVTFDRSAGGGAATGVDPYDTVDDTNSSGASYAFPTTNPTGWQQADGSNWLRDSTSDDGAGGGTAGNALCDGTEDCVYKDRLAGTYWAQASSSMDDWENSISYCESLSYGGYTDWRMPTQKEMLQAYIDGIWSTKAASKLNLLATSYWSSTTNAQSTTNAFTMNFAQGVGGQFSKSSPSSAYKSVCVRP